MQGMKMVDALLGATIKMALEKVVSFATDQIVMVMGFKEDLERLKETVDLILAFVDDAEEKQEKDKAVNLWLKKLEQLASRAEHVLDEINYEMLRRNVEDQNLLKAKVRFMTSHNTNFFGWKMARKFKDINTEFELINKKASALGLQSRVHSVASTTVIPTTVNPEKDSGVGPIVVGRKTVASRIVEKLSSPSNEPLSFIPITGMGGLGKTTLAQFVYQDPKLVNQFDKKIWVSVSEHFEPKRILKLILESLTKKPDVGNFEVRDVIVQRIKEELGGKKYLLVLDDVWNENSGRWDDLLCSLAGISSIPGNWIIVTARKQQVALNLSPRFDFPLEGLSDEDCLKIVKKKAHLGEGGIQEFEAIKDKITELCQGLPLAARVIGGLLSTNGREQWHSVLQEGISNIDGDGYSSVMQILKISFDRLSFPYLKKCFAYCSLFEKDSRMEKRQLIELWMAEGFLQPTLDKDMETGNRCIDILLQSSLLQEVTDEDGNLDPSLVQMHDLVHDLATLISKPKNDVKDVKSEDRYLVVDSFGEETKTLPKMRMLRTLFLGSSVPDDMLMRFKHLHVLKLPCVEKELPSSIGKLIHLRYLQYSSRGIKALPESLCKLYNLQTLNVYSCKNLKALPKGMTKLISLRHLHCDSNCMMPPEMGRLTSLQTLKHFCISEENQIKQLGCLKNLKGKLAIHNLERVSSKGEALRADLYRKPINKLEFVWQGEGGNDEAVFDGLRPHSDLQELRIVSFSGGQFPSWFMNVIGLDKLVSLCISGCKRCEQLPILGQLPSLKDLMLSNLDNISCIDTLFYGIDNHCESENDICSSKVPKKIFPSLKKLKVFSMKNLKDWTESKIANPQAVEMFPNLEHLKISDCSQLRSAPIQHFQSLKSLEIKNSGLNHTLSIIEIYQNCRPSNSTDVQKEAVLTHLESLLISDCHNIRELPEYLYGLQKLRYLDIFYCSSLMSLPVPTRQPRLTSLEELVIRDCNGLTSIPANLLQSCTSLRSLEIQYCSGLTDLPKELLNSCISLERLHIERCDNLTSIPTDFLMSSSTSLHALSFFNLPNLNSLPFDLQQMPSLSSLNLSRLPKLITLPLLLPSHSSRLSELWIGRFSDSVEFDFDWSALSSSSSSSLRQLKLDHWPNLVSLPDPLQHLTALRELQLVDWKQIEYLPDWFSNLVSLEVLWIANCAKICYLPSVAAMRSLTKLSRFYINRCPLLKERCSPGASSNSEWAKISHIPFIQIDFEVIKSEICQNFRHLSLEETEDNVASSRRKGEEASNLFPTSMRPSLKEKRNRRRKSDMFSASRAFSGMVALLGMLGSVVLQIKLHKCF